MDARRNRSLLKDLAQARGWEPAPSAAIPHLAQHEREHVVPPRAAHRRDRFSGCQIAWQLLLETDLTVIALVRAENQAAAHRLARAWWDWPELAAALSQRERVEVLAGDVSLPHLGLDEGTYARLAGRITHIIHAAADLHFDAPLDEMRKTNLQGTANLLGLARLAQRDHGQLPAAVVLNREAARDPGRPNPADQHHPGGLRGRSGRAPALLPGGERAELPPDRAGRVASPGRRAD